MKKAILLLIGLIFCTEIVFSQGFYNRNQNRNFLLTVGTGTTHYYGDLAKSGDNSNIKPNFGIGARYNFYRWFSVGTELTWFMLKGNDKTDPVKETRNLSFQSHNLEVSGLLYYSLFEEDGRFYMRRFANPYLYGGISFISYNPTAELNGQRYNLRKLNTSGEDYSGLTGAFPLGLGVKFRVNSFLNVALDGGYRFVMSDHLDDVSSSIYPDPTSFGNDDVARKLSDRTWETLPQGTPTWAEQGKEFRGNPNNNDGYFIANIKVEYYFSEIGTSSRYRRKVRGGNSNQIKVPKRRKYKYNNKRRRF